MVGEIRDQETAEIAIRASLTGHLVLSTLHTNDAPSALTRLIDIGIEPYLVSSSITLVIAQRLVRLLCLKCKKTASPDLSLINQLGLNPMNTFVPSGCPACGWSGFSGRYGLFEIMLLGEELRSTVTSSLDAAQIRNVARSQGMRTLRELGLELVKSGRTSLEEVLRETV